jgi:hypothetical protein
MSFFDEILRVFIDHGYKLVIFFYNRKHAHVLQRENNNLILPFIIKLSLLSVSVLDKFTVSTKGEMMFKN